MHTTIAADIAELQADLKKPNAFSNHNNLRMIRADADKLRREFLQTAAGDSTMMSKDGQLSRVPQMQYDDLSEIVSKCEAGIAKWDRARESYDPTKSSDNVPVLNYEGGAVGSEFGWPTGGTARQNRGGNLRDIMSHATAEQREELKEFAGLLRGRVSALANLTPSGDGGVMLPVFVQNAIERNYSAFSPVVDNCRIFLTDTGADTKFPVVSDSESAEQVAPSAATGADATVSGDTPPTALTGPTMKAWKVSSKPVFVDREITTDSDIDLVAEVIGALLARVVRFENLKYTRGVGTTEAEGFLYNCSNFEGFDTLDLDVALDLAYSVPALYRPNGVYMASDATIKYLRKLKTGISGDKRQLWAFEDANAVNGTPARLHGYPIYVNNDMSDVHSDGTYGGGLNSPLAFGDFKRFVVRQAEQNRPWIWNYPVPAKDGRGVILFRRSDSHLLVGTAISKLNPSGS